MSRIILLSVLALAASAQRVVDVTPCDDSGNGTLIKFVITPCSTDPCELRKGTFVHFAFTYVADKFSETVNLSGTATGPFGIRLPIPGIDGDMCKVVACPVSEGATYTGALSLRIARIPISKTTVEMKVFGDAGLSACFVFPVTLV
ncbi:mite group 2 allergen Tyr p 2-like [Galendromus occidentalis]|uniref:Mite group 2 allergen Tyr p 2-like n=1 Tax=Galendromus occidentalis TaxID=34638 RepID=A0AAJ6VWW9_9ACAR|nr:mite group 2 allergen Tyr p 2-like [Galendromus occidentalis]